jgi:hypothetical protein
MCWRACMQADMAALLAADLAGAGMACRVEARDRLAVVHPESGGGLDMAEDAVRVRVVALGRKRGFTHVAIALSEGGG